MSTTQKLLQIMTDQRLSVPNTMEKKMHFIRYQWEKDLNELKLQYYDKEYLQAQDWDPSSLNMTVKGPRKCIGHFQNDKHFPCVRQSYVTDFPQCYRCVSYSIPILRCIFEPRCYGDKCIESICNQPHIVYLAFFNTLPKIGMTSKERQLIRIMEQGADAFAVVATTPDRLSARNLERRVSRILQMKESYDPEITLKTLTQRLRKEDIEEKYSLISTSLKDRFGLRVSKLTYMDKYSLNVPLRSMPKLQETIGLHKGKLVGIKGKFLIYDNKGLNALKLNEMLGYFLYFHE